MECSTNSFGEVFKHVAISEPEGILHQCTVKVLEQPKVGRVSSPDKRYLSATILQIQATHYLTDLFLFLPFICFARLICKEQPEMGVCTMVSSLNILHCPQDELNKSETTSGVFVFDNLYSNFTGKHVVEFTLGLLREGSIFQTKAGQSADIYIVPQKQFPGFEPSGHLILACRNQGIKVRIRPQGRRRIKGKTEFGKRHTKGKGKNALEASVGNRNTDASNSTWEGHCKSAVIGGSLLESEYTSTELDIFQNVEGSTCFIADPEVYWRWEASVPYEMILPSQSL